jgi:hypothetical protein
MTLLPVPPEAYIPGITNVHLYAQLQCIAGYSDLGAAYLTLGTLKTSIFPLFIPFIH